MPDDLNNDYNALRRRVIEIADCGWNVGTEITDAILAQRDIVLRALGGTPMVGLDVLGRKLQGWYVAEVTR